MNDKKLDQVLEDHDADGIREYDNPMPSWWLYLFYFTIAFSVIYVPYFWAKGNALKKDSGIHSATAWSRAKLIKDMKVISAKQENVQNVMASPSDLEAILNSPEAIERGEALYVTNCAACHGKGEGIIGPNLTDKYWIHGSSPEAILKVIDEGIIEKGMVAWGPVLGQTKVMELTAYVVTLKGKNLPSNRPPEGVAEDA